MVPFEIEILNKMEQLNEYIMTSLRTMEGLSLNVVLEGWGENERSIIMELSKKSIDRKHLFLHNDQLILTESGKLMADGIASDLFFV